MTEPVPAAGLGGVFHGPRRLRAGWRFAMFLVLYFAFGALVRLALVAGSVPAPDGFAPSTLLLAESLSFAIVLAATLVMGRIEGRSLADFGLPPRRALGRSAWAGFGWGFAAVAAIVAPIAAMSGVHYQGLRYPGATAVSMAALWLASMLVLGLAEESMFRGYALRALTDGLGFWPASVLLFLLFPRIYREARYPPLES